MDTVEWTFRPDPAQIARATLPSRLSCQVACCVPPLIVTYFAIGAHDMGLDGFAFIYVVFTVVNLAVGELKRRRALGRVPSHEVHMRADLNGIVVAVPEANVQVRRRWNRIERFTIRRYRGDAIAVLRDIEGKGDVFDVSCLTPGELAQLSEWHQAGSDGYPSRILDPDDVLPRTAVSDLVVAFSGRELAPPRRGRFAGDQRRLFYAVIFFMCFGASVGALAESIVAAFAIGAVGSAVVVLVAVLFRSARWTFSSQSTRDVSDVGEPVAIDFGRAEVRVWGTADVAIPWMRISRIEPGPERVDLYLVGAITPVSLARTDFRDADIDIEAITAAWKAARTAA